MRKIFEVLIGDTFYDVYDIEGKEHEGLNNTPKTWWLYFSSRIPDGLTPPIDSDNWVEWNAGINRTLWDIHIKQRNSTKEKWGDTQFNNHTRVEILCNKKPFYTFVTVDIAFAMAKAQYLMTVCSEHPFNFFTPEKENGRKIWWYNLPATVVVNTYSPWEIRIKPDYTTWFSKDEWWKEYKERRSKRLAADKILVEEDGDDIFDEDDNDKDNDLINWGDALSDEHIWWFRN